MDKIKLIVMNKYFKHLLFFVAFFLNSTVFGAVPTADSTGNNLKQPAETISGAMPDYDYHLTIFYVLCTLMIILIIAIIVMSTTISTLVKSPYFQEKLKKKNEKESNTIKTAILIIGFMGLLGETNSSQAMSFVSAGNETKDLPWLLVETFDLYFLTIVNISLLVIVLYLRGVFRGFMDMISEVKTETITENLASKKINKILTDAVDIEEEHTILMHHEYDGIRELDNNLPPWWVWGFFVTIVFAIIYLVNYHVLKTSDLQIAAYDKEMNQAKIDIDAYLKKMAMNVDENTATLLNDQGALNSGKSIFEANCIACHKSSGEGDIGPNLTDDYWIYGNDIKDLFRTIKLGTPNGMPEHASKLNPVQIQQVGSFVLSLPNVKGKEPQGDFYKDGKKQ